MKYNCNKFNRSQALDLRFRSKSGFTLVEILVALGIFSLVISITVGTFVGASGSQKKIIELYDTQREASYLMETVSRELRMATAIDGTGGAGDQQDNDDSEIEFTNYDGDLIKYCRSFENGICDGSGKYFARHGKAVNSSDIVVEDLTFYTSETFTNVQPVVTIVMKVKSTGKYGTELKLQNSIAMRLYK